MSRARETAVWLWGVVRNPDAVWVEVHTGEMSTERLDRRTRFHVFKPTWITYAFTTELGCGCRKRFGLWRIIYCSEHAYVWLEGR